MSALKVGQVVDWVKPKDEDWGLPGEVVQIDAELDLVMVRGDAGAIGWTHAAWVHPVADD